MSMSFSVRVTDDDGQPIEGVNVTADFGIFNGQADAYTGYNGWAEIDTSGDYVTCTIFVGGENQGEYAVRDGATFSFSV
ncbi:MAG: hypothetical protein QOJ94_609 [Sphingomonadales bacterium]|jgi:protocatechuate 3,4-dioxygenase beta subunit|nr:hypothetical protein [Sphingomonadales bacterium]